MLGVAMAVLAATVTVGQINEKLMMMGLLERVPGQVTATVTEGDLVALGGQIGLILTTKNPSHPATEELCQRVLDLWWKGWKDTGKENGSWKDGKDNSKSKGKKKGHYKSKSDPRDGM